MRKVYHVEIMRSDGSIQHFYFGSKKAIFNHISQDVLGISYKYLCNLDLSKREYQGRRCNIRMGYLLTANTIC